MRVLIIDEQPIVLAGVRFLVGSDSTVDLVGAFTAESGLNAFAAGRPDVVVLDLQVPGMPSTQLLRRLFETDAKARLLIFTSNDDPVLAAQLIEAGAMGYVSKAEDPEYVVRGMRELAAGRFYISPGLAQKVATLRLAPRAPLSPKITPRERDILNMLAAGKNMTEIAQQANLSYKTISAICNRLRVRFDARTTIELVRIALVLGVC